MNGYPVVHYTPDGSPYTIGTIPFCGQARGNSNWTTGPLYCVQITEWVTCKKCLKKLGKAK